MKKLSTYILIGILGLFLILIRAFENELFYDPFITFFKLEFKKIATPEFSFFKLLLNHVYRYSLNAGISWIILYVFFKDKQLVKFSAILYGVLFVILISIYFYFITYRLEENYLATFYIRRFLIQPLLIFILIPAFYYQKNFKKINE